MDSRDADVINALHFVAPHFQAHGRLFGYRNIACSSRRDRNSSDARRARLVLLVQQARRFIVGETRGRSDDIVSGFRGDACADDRLPGGVDLARDLQDLLLRLILAEYGFRDASASPPIGIDSCMPKVSKACCGLYE